MSTNHLLCACRIPDMHPLTRYHVSVVTISSWAAYDSQCCNTEPPRCAQSIGGSHKIFARDETRVGMA